MKPIKNKYIGLRDWLELGQALRDKSVLGPKYFRKSDTHCIQIGHNLKVRANSKIFYAGSYFLDETL